jgi:hypothetical protein
MPRGAIRVSRSPNPIAVWRLVIALVLVLVTAESLLLLFLAGIDWTLRDFEIGGTLSSQQLANNTAWAIAEFTLTGFNVMGGVLFAFRRRGWGLVVLCGVQAMDIGFLIFVMVGCAEADEWSWVSDAIGYALVPATALALLAAVARGSRDVPPRLVNGTGAPPSKP